MRSFLSLALTTSLSLSACLPKGPGSADACAANAECPEGTVCLDARCLMVCKTNDDCLSGEHCIINPAESEGYCDKAPPPSPCGNEASACSPYASCEKYDSEAVCTCRPGFEGDGYRCDATYLQVAAGDHFTCALRSDHSIWCWGANGRGQLGSGMASVAEASPVPVVSTDSAAQDSWQVVSAGGDFACAIRDDDSLWCWGDNSFGQLGIGSLATSYSPKPLQVAGSYVAVSAGGGMGQHDFACAIDSVGALYCWGDDSMGQLGNGESDTEAKSAPQTLGGNWSAIEAGLTHVCGVNAGALYCWGSAEAGQVGTGTSGDGLLVQQPTSVLGATPVWSSLAAGGAHSCAVRDGSLYCWGLNDNGQLGQGSADVTPIAQPVRVGEDNTWAQVTAGWGHSCAIQRGGDLYCWGRNGRGEVGDGSLHDEPVPIHLGQGFASVNSSSTHSCAIDAAGALWCWGSNRYGELGVGVVPEKSAPTRIGNRLWQRIDAFASSVCGIRSDGSLWCWGEGSYGQLGLGAGIFSGSPMPRQVAPGSTWQSVSLGAWHGCGILEDDGSLWCWGASFYGQLGNGDFSVDHGEPVPVATSAGPFSELSAGWDHTCAIANDGALYCWGDDYEGQIGDGPNADPGVLMTALPSREATVANDWLSVDAGDSFTCATKSDGTLWCWGRNADLQLGVVDDPSAQLAPVQAFAPEADWLAVAASDDFTLGGAACGIRGTALGTYSLWCWGNGPLGADATTQTSPSTPKVQEATARQDWGSVSVGARHAAAVTIGGELYSWGSNQSGALGIGNKQQSDSQRPVREASGTSDWVQVATGADFTCALKVDGTLWCWGEGGDGQHGDGSAWSETPKRVLSSY